MKPLLQNRKVNFQTKNKYKKAIDHKLKNNILKTRKMTNNIEQLKK